MMIYVFTPITIITRVGLMTNSNGTTHNMTSLIPINHTNANTGQARIMSTLHCKLISFPEIWENPHNLIMRWTSCGSAPVSSSGIGLIKQKWPVSPHNTQWRADVGIDYSPASLKYLDHHLSLLIRCFYTFNLCPSSPTLNRDASCPHWASR